MKDFFYLDHPAGNWETGLPAGNGRQGAVVYGGTDAEQILLNEETLWYGGPRKRVVKAGKEKLKTIRDLLERGEAEKAQKLCTRWFTSNPKYLNPYHPAAEARIDFYAQKAAETACGYSRGIDLSEGKVWVKFNRGGIDYKSELFSSMRYQVTVLRIWADKEQSLEFRLSLNRRPFEEGVETAGEILKLSGKSGDGVCYCVGCMVAETDGSVESEGGCLFVEKASFAEILFCVQTDYEGSNPNERCLQLLRSAEKAGYELIEQAHGQDYKALYETMDVRLSGTDVDREYTELLRYPADDLLRRCNEPEVRTYLTQLMFAYARYLRISSSVYCSLPANLQGIWNGSFTPPWESAYTININLQMNYWMADGAGLGLCYEPVLKLMERMLPNGRETADMLYGCSGFVAHHNTNLWGDTGIVGLWLASFLWPTGAAWMSNQLYAHAMYEENDEEIRRVLPFLAESVEFFYDYLYRKDDRTWLCGPSVSPENTYRLPDGQEASVVLGPVMDHQIIRELAGNYLDAIEKAGSISEKNGEEQTVKGRSYKRMAEEILEHLPKTCTGSDGRILEWQDEYEETEEGHRHISHLYGLYPGCEITEEQPELWEGAKMTLERRLQKGGGHTGWSRAWIQCFYARLKEAETLDEQLRLFFTHSVAENLWDIHPPFQIDGNFGMGAAVLEALASRYGEVVEIMRTIPGAWKSGSVRGMRLKGKIILDFSWKGHELKKLVICSGKDQRILLKYPGGHRWLDLHEGESITIK